MIAMILERTDSYRPAFAVGFVLSIIGLILAISLHKKVQKIKKTAC
jgi:hypothetical protein